MLDVTQFTMVCVLKTLDKMQEFFIKKTVFAFNLLLLIWFNLKLIRWWYTLYFVCDSTPRLIMTLSLGRIIFFNFYMFIWLIQYFIFHFRNLDLTALHFLPLRPRYVMIIKITNIPFLSCLDGCQIWWSFIFNLTHYMRFGFHLANFTVWPKLKFHVFCFLFLVYYKLKILFSYYIIICD